MTRHGPDDDSVAQYVAGTMVAAELDDFEQHLLDCESCRAAVHIGAATRVALVESADTRSLPDASRRVRIRWLVAAAACITTLILINRVDSAGQLGAVAPAPFVAGSLRPASDSITALVDSGMVAYAASDFNAAAGFLERAASVDSSSPVAFFLAVSLLMNDENQAALRALERVAFGTAYGTEAAYYRAKVFVRLNRLDSALAVLERATSAASSPRLGAFADSIRRR